MSLKCNKIEKNNSTYQDTYAWILYNKKEYIKAKEWMIKAIQNGGEKSPVILEHYGDVLYQLGDINNAVLQWKKAKQKGKGSEFLEKKIIEGKLYE